LADLSVGYCGDGHVAFGGLGVVGLIFALAIEIVDCDVGLAGGIDGRCVA